MRINKKLRGKKLGEGYYRRVYEYGKSGDYVLKIAKDAEGREANMTEYVVWIQNERSNSKAQGLAAVHAVSKDCKYLLQERVDTDKYISGDAVRSLEKRIPKIVDDFGDYNIGINKQGEEVVIDYGNIKIV